MALAFDAVGPTSSGKTASFSASTSWSHTTGAGSGRLLFVSATFNSAPTSCTATYNGTSMTVIGSQNGNNQGFNGSVWLFGMIAPASGTNTIVVTPSNTSDITAGSVSFSGGDQTTGWQTLTKAFGSSSGTGVLTGSITVGTGNGILGVGTAGQLLTLHAGTNAWNANLNTGQTAGQGAGAYTIASGSQSVNWSLATSSVWAWMGIEVIAGASGTPANVTGVGAVVTAAGGVGSVQAGANVPGTGAVVTAAGGAGSVQAGANASGAGASVSLSGGAGSVQAGANVSGAGSHVPVAGGAGSIQAGASTSGAGAHVPVSGGAGSVQAGANVTGTGAHIGIAGGIGVPAGGTAQPKSPALYGGTATVVANTLGGTATVVSTLGGTATVKANTLGGTASVVNTLGFDDFVESTMQEQDIVLTEYNDNTVTFQITDSGVAKNITGDTINAYFKKTRGDLDSAGTTKTYSSAGGSPAITVTNASTGMCSLSIPIADITSVSVWSFWRVDVVTATPQTNAAIFGTVAITAL